MMEKYKFDVKKIEERLNEEFPNPRSRSTNKRSAESIAQYPSVLHETIEHWINGEYVDFTFKGISLREIIERTNLSYPEALNAMCTLLENPTRAEWYSKHMEEQYGYDIVGENTPEKRRNYKWQTK